MDCTRLGLCSDINGSHELLLYLYPLLLECGFY